MRKAAATKAPVAIDYVAALETTVERHAKAKVTYVYNRICRLPIEAQHLFLRGFKVGFASILGKHKLIASISLCAYLGWLNVFLESCFSCVL